MGNKTQSKMDDTNPYSFNINDNIGNNIELFNKTNSSKIDKITDIPAISIHNKRKISKKNITVNNNNEDNRIILKNNANKITSHIEMYPVSFSSKIK